MTRAEASPTRVFATFDGRRACASPYDLSGSELFQEAIVTYDRALASGLEVGMVAVTGAVRHRSRFGDRGEPVDLRAKDGDAVAKFHRCPCGRCGSKPQAATLLPSCGLRTLTLKSHQPVNH